MERHFLTVFILILIVSLATGLAWNVILDVGNRGEAIEVLRQTYQIAEANDSKKFVDATMIIQSMIYGDYDQEDLWKRVGTVSDLYRTFAGMSELKSVDLVKALDRTACLVQVTFADAEGKEAVRYVLVVKYQDRAERETWVPHSVLTIEESRRKELAALEKMADRDAARKDAQDMARAVLAAPAEAPEAKIADVLSTLKITPEQAQAIGDSVKRLVGAVPPQSLVAAVKSQLYGPFATIPKRDSPQAYYKWFISELKTAVESKREVPELEEPARKIADILLDKNRLVPEKVEDLTKLARITLQNPGARTVFVAECELADVLGADAERLIEDYAELTSLPGEIRVRIDQVVAGLVANQDTLNCWTEMLKLDDAAKRQGTLVALKRFFELKSLDEMLKLSEGSQDESVKSACKSVMKVAFEMMYTSEEEYLGLAAADRGRLTSLLAEEAAKVQADLAGDEAGLRTKEIAKGISADALDRGDLYEARVRALRDMLRSERSRRDSVAAGMRRRIEALVKSFPAEWQKMKSKEEYLKWAFPGKGMLEQARRDMPGLVSRLEQFAEAVIGKKVAASITHHWYPDPEQGFSRAGTGRLSEIVRVRYDIKPEGEEANKEFRDCDFMLVLEMAEDWTVGWKLYRACSLSEKSECRRIAEEERKKREAYLSDDAAGEHKETGKGS